MLDFRSFADELMKLSALSPEESAEFKEHVRQQAAYDQRAATGQMTDAEKELHRHHTSRMQEYLKKKKDDNHSIPSWARDPKGTPPSASDPFGGSSYSRPRPNPSDPYAGTRDAYGRPKSPPPGGGGGSSAGGSYSRPNSPPPGGSSSGSSSSSSSSYSSGGSSSGGGRYSDYRGSDYGRARPSDSWWEDFNKKYNPNTKHPPNSEEWWSDYHAYQDQRRQAREAAYQDQRRQAREARWAAEDAANRARSTPSPAVAGKSRSGLIHPHVGGAIGTVAGGVLGSLAGSVANDYLDHEDRSWGQSPSLLRQVGVQAGSSILGAAGGHMVGRAIANRFSKAAAALQVKLPPKLPAAAAKGWAPGAAMKATGMGIKPKAVSVGTEAAKTVLSSADYDYVMREAFREELSKLSHSPEMIEALSKVAFQLGGRKVPEGLRNF